MFENKFYSGFVLQKAGTPSPTSEGADSSSTSDTPFVGSIRKLRAREVLAGGKPSTLATHRIYCATSVNIATEDTITYGGKTYHVLVSNDVMEAGGLRQTDVEHRA